MISAKADIVAKLQSEIMKLEGFKPSGAAIVDAGLNFMSQAFPNGIFPTGAVHEFLSSGTETLTATIGFVSGLLSHLMGEKGITVWISNSSCVYPPALKAFGVQPHRCVFIHPQQERDVLWVMDEALKCGAITAVVAELKELSFTASRRLQLAVEESQATGFVLRTNYKKIVSSACLSRWRITSIPSESIDDLPGIGFPQWKVELLRMRNGKPGEWCIQWRDLKFRLTESHQNQKLYVPDRAVIQFESAEQKKKAG